MRSGHRSAHMWLVLLSAILVACVLLYGWVTFSGRPEPEPLAAACSEAAEPEWARGPAVSAEAAPGTRP
ncbi:MAG: hypothetical protein OXI71_02820 [Gemmatimonadota bacterium]|nr:hypothetical protein [Gemmatimonadota bacterium]MDE2678395.1 hypothetical protein [Gemmatimonadota bacterium]